MDSHFLILVRLLACFLVLYLSPSTASAQSTNEQSRPAYLGQSTRGGSVSNPELNFAVERALKLAGEYQHELCTPEHLLLALLDEPSVLELLSSQGVDVMAVKSQLEAYLLSLPKADSSGVPPLFHPLLSQVVAQAYAPAVRKSERSINGAAVVLAMMGNEQTYASKVLVGAGATIETLAAQSDKQRQAQEDRREWGITRMEGMIESLPGARKSADISPVIGSEPGPVQSQVLQIRVASTSGSSIRFKAAVSHDGQLDLYIEETPFVIDLRATRLAALFETVEGGMQIKVEMTGELGGERHVLGGFGGESGALFRDPGSYSSQCSGHL